MLVVKQGIYEIRNTENGAVYVGQSVNTERRMEDHRKALTRDKHYNPYLQEDWNAYGEKAFTFEHIETVYREALLLPKERERIDGYVEAEVRLYNIVGVKKVKRWQGPKKSVLFNPFQNYQRKPLVVRYLTFKDRPAPLPVVDDPPLPKKLIERPPVLSEKAVVPKRVVASKKAIVNRPLPSKKVVVKPVPEKQVAKPQPKKPAIKLPPKKPIAKALSNKKIMTKPMEVKPKRRQKVKAECKSNKPSIVVSNGTKLRSPAEIIREQVILYLRTYYRIKLPRCGRGCPHHPGVICWHIAHYGAADKQYVGMSFREYDKVRREAFEE